MMEKTKRNVPEFRFPGFSEEWGERVLQDITDVKSKKYNPEFETTSVKCIELEHLASESGQILGYIDGQFSGSIKNRFSKGDVLFGKLRPYLRKYLLAPFDGVCSSEIWVLQSKDVANEFLYSLVQTNKFIDLANISSGSKMPRADWSVVSNGIFNIPSLPEQQKISSSLLALDERLQTLKKKKTLLEQYKKGVMQKIFSQEIRVKDETGNDYPDWEEKTLGEVALKKTIKNKDNDVNTVLTNSASSGIVYQRDFFDKDIANQNNLLNYYIVEKDDFVYNPRISNLAPVGPIGRNHLETGVMSPLYSVFKFTQGNLEFFEIFFSTTVWHEYMESIANYGARADRMNITTAGFYLMPIPFPSIPEQNKIANFLSAIDEKINLCTTQIEKTEQYKKGLLQKMFV